MSLKTWLELYLILARELTNFVGSLFFAANSFAVIIDFDNFEKEIVDTLSEENLEEFTLDKWIEMYHQAKVLQEKKNVIYADFV